MIRTSAAAPPAGTGGRARRRFGMAVAVWSLAYLTPHAYWALGNRSGLIAVAAGVGDQGFWRPINAIASVILLIAAIVGVAHALSARPRPPLLAITWVGASIAVVHGVYGVAARAASVASLGIDRATPDIWWDLLVFEPWFLIEGVLLGLAGYFALPDPQGRRGWLLGWLVGILAAGLAALLKVRVG